MVLDRLLSQCVGREITLQDVRRQSKITQIKWTRINAQSLKETFVKSVLLITPVGKFQTVLCLRLMQEMHLSIDVQNSSFALTLIMIDLNTLSQD